MQDIGSIAATIKERVSCLDAGKHMGLEPDSHGFCRCPFHQEKTGSLKLYKGDRGWHCFGCGANGDVISLTMGYYGITFRQAVIRLDTEWRLGLNLTGKPLSDREQKTARRRRELAAMNRQTDELIQQSL